MATDKDCDHCYRLGVREGYERGWNEGTRSVAETYGLPQMAAGGIVTRPTVALIGESGPEMVVPLDQPKKKRKVSRYQKEFGRQMKRLKALHPRTKVTALMSRGHSATRKALGMKQKRRSR